VKDGSPVLEAGHEQRIVLIIQQKMMESWRASRLSDKFYTERSMDRSKYDVKVFLYRNSFLYVYK